MLATEGKADLMSTWAVLLICMIGVLVRQVTPHMCITDTPEHAELKVSSAAATPFLSRCVCGSSAELVSMSYLVKQAWAHWLC